MCAERFDVERQEVISMDELNKPEPKSGVSVKVAVKVTIDGSIEKNYEKFSGFTSRTTYADINNFAGKTATDLSNVIATALLYSKRTARVEKTKRILERIVTTEEN